METYWEKCKMLTYKTTDNLKKEGVRATIKKIFIYMRNKIYSSQNIHYENTYSNGFYNLYQDNDTFITKAKVKAIAFYLPQYHTFPENDRWWGKGFTEWTNTRKSAPRYRGHYQPREPHEDIGYYDLSNVENLKKQAMLAKQHGIYGFCIYYYWFSGKRLMEKPLDILLEHKEIDINFCLCWANENWTRAWDGLNKNVLIQQDYTQDDPIKFINDIKKYIDDDRYIKHHGKPIIIVYNPESIPDVKKVIHKWKKVANNNGIGDISVWICRSFQNSIASLDLDIFVDKEIEFPPHNFWGLPIAVHDPAIRLNDSHVFDYSRLVDYILQHRSDVNYNMKLCRTVMLGWDNSARRAKGFDSFDNFAINKYYEWLRANVDEVIDKHEQNDRYVFINAWNEWAEGTYLEPDRKYGYSYLNITSQALSQKDYCMQYDIKKGDNVNCKIAVQVNIIYVDLIDELLSYINNIPEAYDCYITTDSVYIAQKIISVFKTNCSGNKIVLTVYRNELSNMLPFFMQLKNIAKYYQYICHISSERLCNNPIGEKLRTYLLSNLLGTPNNVAQIKDYFDNNEDVGLIYPRNVKTSLDNLKQLDKYNKLINSFFSNFNISINFDQNTAFPIRNMLWIRVEAVLQLFDDQVVWRDFFYDVEQMDESFDFIIERIWNYLAESNGYKQYFMNISNVEDRF